MKYKSLIFVTLFSLISTTSFAESIPLSLDDLAKIFSTYFPKIEGNLSNVEGSTGTINLGKKEGLVKGMVLVILRPGEPFYHPITKEEMGVYEEKLGFIEVNTLKESESSGNLLIKGKRPKIGDKVRISSARIPVNVEGESEKGYLVLIDEFSRSLLETNRFSVPSFSKISDSSPSSLKIEPLYEFKVKSISNQAVQIDLYNLPFNHLIEELTGTIGKF